MENAMKRTLLGTALAMTLFATPVFAQQQPGTGGGAGGESGSSGATDKTPEQRNNPATPTR
jgi:hypothetical protein